MLEWTHSRQGCNQTNKNPEAPTTTSDGFRSRFPTPLASNLGTQDPAKPRLRSSPRAAQASLATLPPPDHERQGQCVWHCQGWGKTLWPLWLPPGPQPVRHGAPVGRASEPRRQEGSRAWETLPESCPQAPGRPRDQTCTCPPPAALVSLFARPRKDTGCWQTPGTGRSGTSPEAVSSRCLAGPWGSHTLGFPDCKPHPSHSRPHLPS